ncbi:transglycosylase SLT domain-containing protein [Aquabacterium sp.]|uniref:transglycosylase SLT domain-containing protein n=1 Tax=Aquabacterium sp. TaxID=1872578 RepID=UPI00378372CA
MTHVHRLIPTALAALLLAACATTPEPISPPAPPPVVAPASDPAPPPVPEPVAATPAEPEPDAVAIDPLRPDARIDPNDQTARVDLWGRVRQGFGMSELDNDYVRKWEQWYASRPDYVQRMTERGGRYLFHILEELGKRNMPTELALLPFIESAYNPEAMSRAKASGMWQFVPGTGRDFDLKQNVFRDDRRDVLASTRAALDYLQSLYGMFGDWQLALAAYNWGQGNVQRAIARNQRQGLGSDYTSLRMPDETRNYLPKLQAVKNIVLRPDAFALALPPLQNHPYFLSVPIQRDLDVDLAARLAGLPEEEFRQLNPQMNKPVILAAGTPQVLLPYDNANTFVRALGQYKGTLASWTAWVAPKTVKPAEAARLVGMSEAQLRDVNHIPRGMLVKAGSTLLVPRDAKRHEDVAEHIADHAMLALAPDRPATRRVSFKAGKKGDTVAAVARRYKVSPAQVAQWNKTSVHSSFKPGQLIQVVVANTAPSASSKPVRVAARPGGATGRRITKPGPAARTRVSQN